MTYVDAFVLPVAKRKRAAYVRMAKIGCNVWMDHGALSYIEAEADDVAVGKRTSFPRSVKLKRTETVWVSFITYRSRKHRDAVMKKVMADKRFAPFMSAAMPFDGKRMFWGGFKAAVED
jgi:uncharacterized protein YbaA (DUF1428 family)